MPDDAPPFIHGLTVRSGEDTPRGPFAPTGKFGRMYPELLAFEPPDEDLEALGDAMSEPPVAVDGVDDPTGDNDGVPVGFTYLGQFIDHDITFDTTSLKETLVDPLALHNFRSPALDLDCLYGGGPAVQPYLYRRRPDDPDLFEVGRTVPGKSAGDPELAGKPAFPNDLPRAASGLAVIGDPRNDENLVVAQLHLAFLKFHNEVVAQIKAGTIEPQSPIRKSPFEEARDLVVWHYQWIVLHDFLGRILDPAQLDHVLEHGSSVFRDAVDPFMPVEFSVAAYRLGHSMVRGIYDFNRVFRPGGVFPATLELLFAFSGRSSVRGSSEPSDDPVPIPSDWIIDWRRFFEIDPTVTPGLSRKLNPFLADPLGNLPNVPPPSSLAVRNLLRGKRLGLPPGQSVARHLGFEPLSPDQIATGSDGQVAAAHNLHVESPLWYYILKEAEIQGAGARLGQVGSRIVAEVLVGLLQKDPHSYLVRRPNWAPSLPSETAGDFTMADLLRLVGELNPIADSAADIADRTFAELRQENPNIGDQLAEWRDLRRQRGEDRNDYRAFRRHLLAIGAPDPGEQEFVGFRS